MTVDEYLAWAEGRPGRYELYGGEVFQMAPERAVHAELKFAVQLALREAINRAGLPCHMLPDGMTVRVDRYTAHEPDALVYRGPKLPNQAIEVPDPVMCRRGSLTIHPPRRCCGQAGGLWLDPQHPPLLDR